MVKIKRFNLLLIIGVIAVALPLLQPVFIAPARSIIPTRALSLSQLQAYYSIVYSIFAILVGVAGLGLGFFYFHNRKRVEREASDRDHLRKRADILMEELNAYDKCVHRVLGMSVRDAQELTEMRVEIERIFEVIQDMLDQWQSLLGLKDDDLRRIIRINSFVDKCDTIMRTEFAELSLQEMYPIKDRYQELVREARRTCYVKIL